MEAARAAANAATVAPRAAERHRQWRRAASPASPLMGARASRPRACTCSSQSQGRSGWPGGLVGAADEGGQAWQLGAGAPCVESHSAPAGCWAGLVSNSGVWGEGGGGGRHT
eukprot:scaffold12794_cov125-Isochrysis_galbana.AAC.6